MDYQIRTARIIDVDRIVALLGTLDAAGDAGPGMAAGPADLLRQLIGLPHAVVMVAESNRRIIGAALLALRPSVQKGGFIGTIDAFHVDPGAPSSARAALVSELLRAARNKGCVAVEADAPAGPTDRARWTEAGFVEAGPRIVRSLAPVGARRT